MRPIDKPLAWVGPDRILLDDVTQYGLRRQVIARKDDLPDIDGFLESAMKQAGALANVYGWLIERDGFRILWLVWKVKYETIS